MRFLIRFLIAVAIGSLSFFAALSSGMGQTWYMSPQGEMSFLLEHQDWYVQRFISEHHKVPQSWDDIPEGNSYASDGWNNKTRLEAQGKSYDIIDYGRDGVPGGQGLDADVSLRHPQNADETLSLREQMGDPYYSETFRPAIWAGLLCSVLSILTVRFPKTLKWDRWAVFLFSLLCLSFFSTWFAAIIGSLHAPSSH